MRLAATLLALLLTAGLTACNTPTNMVVNMSNTYYTDAIIKITSHDDGLVIRSVQAQHGHCTYDNDTKNLSLKDNASFTYEFKGDCYDGDSNTFKLLTNRGVFYASCPRNTYCEATFM
ncbi:MAG: hypothetical protein LBU72_04100 [Burkholderiaceae bacterium]|jgi:hypothetical protein|nr:hypothetical protein [Burkholderiaceae bacterium]